MSKPVYRVALLGPAGSGKSSQSKLLQKALGGDVLSFAGPLKKILRDIFDEKMDDPDFYRTACQQFGTDFVRKLDPDAWVRMLGKKVPATRSAFVDDCRFHNEYHTLERLGFTFIRLSTSPNELKRRRPTLTATQAQHESELEQAQFPADWVVRTDPILVFDDVSDEAGTATTHRETEEESILRVHRKILGIVQGVPFEAVVLQTSTK